MAQIQDNKATELVYGQLFGYDFENEVLPKIEDLEKIISVYTFREYVYTHAVRCGFAGNVSDTEQLQQFVAQKCNEAGIELGNDTEGILGRWLNGLPAKTVDGRDNVYKLCFALQMNAAQTMEFFLKAYLERPFNYKQIAEAVYFYCLKNGSTYADAMRIISVVEAHDIVPNPYADNVTEQIGAQLAEIESEEKLIAYLVENRSGFLKQNQTATHKLNDLKQACFEIAPKEYAISCNTNADEMTIKNNIESLLNVIYGYGAALEEKNKKVFKKSFKDSKLPKLITNNWPDKMSFSKIKGGTASYDVIRRALIMLVFYDFFANAIVAEKEAEQIRKITGQKVTAPSVAGGLFDEFATETNTILADCGYVQLYWRNPFDWLIGYCAQSIAPLDTLREFIEEYYLSDEEVCDQPPVFSEDEIIARLMRNQ